MANGRPKTVKELFDFYYIKFKPLYCHLQSINEPPIEIFFELNAAFDHLSRHWQYGQTEDEAVGAACAHLKRGCFDAFKIVVRQAMDHFTELRSVDTSIIDNGDFDRGMLQLVGRIQAGATKARQAEGDSRDETSWHTAFDLWEPVYQDCVAFERNYYLNDKVEWARKKQTRESRRAAWFRRVEGAVLGVVTSLLVWWLTSCGSAPSSTGAYPNVQGTDAPASPRPPR
ncbi:MAG TPA: hypothetical protein P5137_02300 [Candidatus Brocadiia bacterium]|nr:hypothetical protein [Candidatus Brocadiia bacterium]